jgi:[histone H3]-lysine36 N-dimethyltransferase SETMAR
LEEKLYSSTSNIYEHHQQIEKINGHGVWFQHQFSEENKDNLRPHFAKITQQKNRDLGREVLPHPPYTLNIAPSDYHLFRSLEHFLSGKIFRDTHTEYFASKQASFYREGIEKLPQRWGIVLDNDGEYIIDQD